MYDDSNPTHVASLKTELTTDPEGIGYLSAGTNPPDPAAIVDLLNADDPAAGTVNDNLVDSAAIRAAIPHAELAAIIADAVAFSTLQFYLADSEAKNTSEVRAFFQSLGPSGSSYLTAPTLSALNLLTQRTGSRLEVLFGLGSRVSRHQAMTALNS